MITRIIFLRLTFWNRLVFEKVCGFDRKFVDQSPLSKNDSFEIKKIITIIPLLVKYDKYSLQNLVFSIRNNC